MIKVGDIFENTNKYVTSLDYPIFKYIIILSFIKHNDDIERNYIKFVCLPEIRIITWQEYSITSLINNKQLVKL